MKKSGRQRPVFAGIILLTAVALIAAVCLWRRNSAENGSGADDTATYETTYVESESYISPVDVADDGVEHEASTEQMISPDTENSGENATETAGVPVNAFYRESLSEDVKARICGISYPKDGEKAQISYEELAYVHVLHYDFNGQVQEGELICNQTIAQDLVEIFEELYEHQYPIEKIRLVDEYGGDDDASMADNNTSCFNYRLIAGTDRLSNHSYGLAIDINPFYNPYVTTRGGQMQVSPVGADAYADRSQDFAYKIDREDLCYQLFIAHGFTWGGDWKNSKDYQHFEKTAQ